MPAMVKLVAGREVRMLEGAAEDAEDDELSPGEHAAVAPIVGAVGDSILPYQAGGHRRDRRSLGASPPLAFLRVTPVGRGF
jgi:hypothetical protein